MDQISMSQWPDGLDYLVSTILLDPKEIEANYSIKFENGSDDLDDFKVAIVKIENFVFALRSYLGSTQKGTDLLIMNDTENKKEIVKRVLNFFRIEEESLIWLHPSAGGSLRRRFVDQVLTRLSEEDSRIQMLYGPRQVGKTTGVRQIQKSWSGPSHYVSADMIESHQPEWLIEQWQIALSKGSNCLLIIDEYQKIKDWDSQTKSLWDSRRKELGLRLILLGSTSPDLSPLLQESLAGRFEKIYVPHWSYQELKTSFEFDLNKFLVFGGYPGSAGFVNDFDRWLEYMGESIFKAALVDIQTTNPVKNVNELTRIFDILCEKSGSQTSYRMLLHDIHSKGNTKTVKHLIELYEKVFLFKSISKYESTGPKSSSPKVFPRCPALHTYGVKKQILQSDQTEEQMFELAVGADLMQIKDGLSYWSSGHKSVDYVLQYQGQTYAIEVKGSKAKDLSGLNVFKKKYPDAHQIILSPDTYESWSRDPLSYLKYVSPDLKN